MDPKLSNIDPKLQDAYNRVMGTTSNSQGSSNPPPPANPDPALSGTFSQPVAPPQTQNPYANNPIPQSIQLPTSDPTPAPPPTYDSAPPPPSPQVMETFPQQPMPVSEPTITAPMSSPVTVEPEPSPSTPSPISDIIPGVNSTVAFNATDSGKNIGTTPVKKHNLHLLPILIGIGVVFLLVAYTFLWIFIFKVQLPFLPSFS